MAWALREVFARWSVDWIMEQHFVNWGAGLVDLALEFRKEQLHVCNGKANGTSFLFPTWEKCDPFFAKGPKLEEHAIKLLAKKAVESPEELNLSLAAAAVIRHLFEALKAEGTQPTAVERLEDLLVLWQLSSTTVQAAWKAFEKERPGIHDSALESICRAARDASWLLHKQLGEANDSEADELTAQDAEKDESPEATKAKKRVAVLKTWVPYLRFLTQLPQTKHLENAGFEPVRKGMNLFEEEVQKLSQRSHLSDLDLSNNPIHQDALGELFFLIRLNAGLEKLNLTNTGLQAGHLQKLREALDGNTVITDLKLSSNGFSHEAAAPLVTYRKKRPAGPSK